MRRQPEQLAKGTGAISLRGLRGLQDVVDWGLCTGCGICASLCSHQAIALINIESVGIRPKFSETGCGTCSDCLPACPGFKVDAETATGPVSASVAGEFGPALEIWEGYAADSEIRYNASSGGALSALSLYCLDREGMEFVLHTAKDEAKPWINRTVESRNRQDLLSRTGSRYAPASPCDGLKKIEESSGPCVFIGKPCDTAAVFAARNDRPELDRNLGLVLAFFCAGTPNTQGTLALLKSRGVDPGKVETLRYRGQGWPGKFRVLHDGGQEVALTYAQSWGELTRYRPSRCHLCPDGLGRVADIACGDAWDKFEENSDPGRSLILVRTERGRRILRGAIEAGYVVAKPAGTGQVLEAQKNLLARRREIFGRLVGMKLLGAPVPQFPGFSLFQSWSQLPLKRKVQTVAGTVVRMLQRGTWRPRPLF